MTKSLLATGVNELHLGALLKTRITVTHKIEMNKGKENSSQEEIDYRILTMVERNVTEEENRTKFTLDDCVKDVKQQIVEGGISRPIFLSVDLGRDSYINRTVQVAFNEITEWFEDEGYIFTFEKSKRNFRTRYTAYEISVKRSKKRPKKRSRSPPDDENTEIPFKRQKTNSPNSPSEQ